MTAATRRQTLVGTAAAAAAALPPLARPLRAQAARWEPSRPIVLLVGFAPGGGTDIISRLLQPVMQAELGQPITVENRPGASGTIAALAGTRAPPDGHTLFMTTVSASAVVPPQMKPPPFDIHRDQTAIVLAATVPLVVVVPVSSPARDLRGLIELARAKPGRAELLLLRRRHPAAPGGGAARRARRRAHDACALPRHRARR